MDTFKILFHLNRKGQLPELAEIIEFERPRGLTNYEFKNYVVQRLIDNIGFYGKDAADQTAFVFRNSKLAFYVDCITTEDGSRLDSDLAIVRIDGHRHFYRTINIAC